MTPPDDDQDLRPTTVEAPLQALLDAAPDAMVGVDPSGTIVMANLQCEALFGYDRDALIGKRVEVLVPEGLVDVHPAHRARYFAEPRTRRMGVGLDLVARRADGTEFPAEISLSSIQTESGIIALAAIRDLSARKSAEATFQSMLDAAPDAMVGVSSAGIIVMANSQTEAVFGYSRGELIGQGLEILIPEVSREVHPKHQDDYFSSPRVRPMGAGLDLAGLRSDGSEFPAEISLSWIETPEGIVALGAIRDITDRKEQEQETRRARAQAEHASAELQEALQRERREAEVRRAALRGEQELRRQALIVENIHDGVITVDLENRIIDMNPAAEELTGYETQEVVGRQPEFFGGGGVEDQAAWRETISEGMEREGRYFGEVMIHRKDGTQRVSELIIVPLRDARGDVLGAVGVNRDITGRKQAEDKLRETIDQLRETDRTRRDLLSRLISAQEEERLRIADEIHDDPVQQLFAATLRLGMLREKLTDPEQLEIHAKAATLVETTVSRLRRMLFELQPRSLETDGLAAALSEYFAYANDEGGTTFALRDRLTEALSQDMRTVAYRIVLESLSNVRKHAAATTATVTIEDHEDGIRCRVVDDGRGFMTVDIAQYQPGHLGVPAMRERVEFAGGRFEISSTPGEGTTVEFWLPAA